jgi:REP element-mobilizing transposase RayT
MMVRGINKSSIFKDDQDRIKFLERLGANVMEGKCSVYAWALMTNHVHLLLKSGQLGVSALMRKLLTWYAQYFNRKYRRTGHLFENRYKSILCEEEKYLLALVRYIHLNPIRAKIATTVRQLDRYPWSGHSAIMGSTKLEWMDTGYVLSQFGAQENAARKAYRHFMDEGIGMGRKPELTGGGLIRSKGGWSQVLSARRSGDKEESDERILGSGDFVAAVLKETEEKSRSQLKLRRTGHSIRKIIEEECKKGRISPAEVKGGSRRGKVSEVRAVIAIRTVKELGLSMAEIARHVGVTTSSVAKAITRLEDE